MRFVSSLFSITISSTVMVVACSSSRRSAFDDDPPRSPVGTTDPSLPSGVSDGPGFGGGAPSGGSEVDPDHDPVNCEEAALARTYVGCDYWATVTGNVVPDVFDFAVVVSNIGQKAAGVRVRGPNGVDQLLTVAPGSLEKVFLPWVPELKGVGLTGAGKAPTPFTESIIARKSAYHIESSVPVVVYQFNPLEYAGKGGPPGKSWAGCPELGDKGSGCYSYSNDASLLMPSTAWTGNYRVTALNGWTNGGIPGYVAGEDVMGGYAAITASEDDTLVKLALGAKAKIVGGSEISAADGGGSVELRLDAGDVAQVVTEKGAAFDLAGTLVHSTKPVQVISGIQCVNVPSDKPACDHVEESVLPAEALGKEYVVTTPTRPTGGPGMHVVRFVGNRNGTKLTYAPAKPAGCPDTLEAGEVAECSGTVSADFVVTGTDEFGVAGFMVGGTMYASGAKAMGDPSQTIFASNEQFRKSYIFLTPDDYDVSYAVVVGPEAAAPVLDGAPASGFTPLTGETGVWRVTLKNGTHTLTSSQPVGLQVMGYGAYTSYQFPGGLNIKMIAPPPPPK